MSAGTTISAGFVSGDMMCIESLSKRGKSRMGFGNQNGENNMITRNDTDVQQFLDENSKVIIMFSASWCGPCKTFKPKFQNISLENPDIVFAYCDVEETNALATELEIQSVPTVVSFFDGIEVASVVGPSVDRVKELVVKLRSKTIT